MSKLKKMIMPCIAGFVFFLNSVSASAFELSASYIESLYELTCYNAVFVPVKPIGEKGDFYNDFTQCINVDGELYSVGLEHSERWSDWDSFVIGNETDVLPLNSFADIRRLEPFGYTANSESGLNPSPLYRVSEDIIIIEDYHCIYNENGELYRFSSEEKYFGYRLCHRVSEERLYRSCWFESCGDKYYVGKDGLPVTKNTVIDGTRYKFNKNGTCEGKYTGWTKSTKGKRYWKNGKLLKNKTIRTKSGKVYKLDSKGYATLKA